MSELILYAFNKYNKCLLFVFLARTITLIANFCLVFSYLY